ncbi:hypothetical protein [Streptomyces crystallinus]|uniref:Integral membrane protein n=1 Tax=Streptomyces crystallinus TaxID=68191 RepID=A0ABP3Q2V4_9ACTN
MTATPSTTKTDATRTDPTDREADAEVTAVADDAPAEKSAAGEAVTEEALTDRADEADGADVADRADGAVAEDDDELDGDVPPAEPVRTGIGAGAAAVVSAALGLASLTGTWTGKVLSERETLLGQIKTAQGGTASAQIHEIYGDSWHTTAAVNGGFALLALLVGAFVLARPAFGAPEAQPPQPVWLRAVALGGVVLGALGLLLSVGMYFDLFATLPSTGS